MSRVCVIIPTYNNDRTLKKVIDGVRNQVNNHIIIVNDGSTDTTASLLEEYQKQLPILHIKRNIGKGNALRAGFKHARALGYDYAITIDSDGQHFPDDIPVFIHHQQQAEVPTLLIGNRDMTQSGVPKKSSFGNRFSNFWYWVETGKRLDDTQSGYRMYPLDKLPKKLYTNKFEFEIEVIVRTSWKGVPVKNIPVKVLYDPAERVSHFRPFKDFTRISLLNTVLVFWALVYIKPRDFFGRLKKKA